MTEQESLKEVASEWEEIWSRESIETEIKKIELESHYTQAFSKLFPKDSRVLEAGCGYGRYCHWLETKGIEAVGIDIVRVAVKTGKEYAQKHKLHRSTLFLGDVTRLPFKSYVFDGYISLGVIEHFQLFDDVEKTFQEAFRVLKPGGMVYISVLNPIGINRLIAKISNPFGLTLHLHSLKKLILAAQGAHFAVLKIDFHGFYYIFYTVLRFLFGRELWSLKRAMMSVFGVFDRLIPFCFLGNSLSMILKRPPRNDGYFWTDRRRYTDSEEKIPTGTTPSLWFNPFNNYLLNT